MTVRPCEPPRPRALRFATAVPALLGAEPAARAVACTAIVAAAFAALVAIAAPALAHDPDGTLEPVNVRAERDAPIGSTDAASRGAVDVARIQARPALRAADVLEWIPGMVVTQHSGDGKANQYFLRGFNLDHGTDFATSVAGVPVNLPTHAHGHGYTDLNFVVPEWVERIEWSKGPYSALDGDFSAAGAADLRLRSQLARPMGQVTLGGNGGYRRLLGAASSHVADGHLLLGVEALANDGPWEVPQHARRTNLLARWSAGTAADGHDVTLMGYDARWTSTDQVPQRAIDAGTIGRYGSLDPTTGGDSSRWSLSGGWRGGLQDEHNTKSAWVFLPPLNPFSPLPPPPPPPAAGDQFEQADARTAYGLRVARTWRATLGGLPTTTTLGVQARQDRIDVGLYDTQARERLATVRADRVASTQTGVFAEHTTFWSERVRTVAGLRLDRQDNRVDASLPDNGGRASAAIASPKLALVVTPSPTLETFGSIGRGFHSNDARGSTTRLDPRTGDAVVPVRPLVPALGYELGARWAPSPSFVASVAAWVLEIDSELVFVGDAGTTEPSRASRRQGVELNARWMPWRWLALDADLSLSRARFVDGDVAGPFIPGSVGRVASLGASVVGAGAWSGGLRVRHVGPRPLVEDGSVESSPFTLADLRIAYRVAPRVDVLLDAFNLTDRRANDIEYFYRSRLAGEPAAGVDDRHLHPAEPRTLRLSLRLGF